MKMMNKQAIKDICSRETRRYTFGPQKLVHDLNTGNQLSDLNLVLEGEIEPFIRGRIIASDDTTHQLIDCPPLIAILYIYFCPCTNHTTSKDDLCKISHFKPKGLTPGIQNITLFAPSAPLHYEY